MISGLRALVAVIALMPTLTRAQWTTESFGAKAGWTAIWMPLDASHATIDALLAAQPDIEEVWRWNPPGGPQFTATPSTPVQTDVSWSVWKRGFPTQSTLFQFTGNNAYLIKVRDGAPAVSFSIKGRPLPPDYNWSTSGVNFIGFPIAEATAPTSRRFDRFFSFDATLKTNPSVLAYVGGALSSVAPKNPLKIGSLAAETVSRNVGYWVQATGYTDYYGPLRITVADRGGLDFAKDRVALTLRLKNVVDPVRNQTLTVTLTPVASQTPPVGQPAIAGAVPLKLRGALDLATSQFAYTALTAPTALTLAPGEEKEIVLVADRAAMGATAGALFQSLLRVTDSLGLTQIDLPVSAVSSDLAGLWAGAAVIDQVNQVTGALTEDAAAPAKFPLRLLVHRAADGKTVLLQQVYLGSDGTTSSLAVAETNFPGGVKPSARMSSAHFPVSLARVGTGQLAATGAVSFTVALGHDANTNPFVHRYHPDHDNLDERFENVLPAGRESLAVTRQITLTFQPTLPGIVDPAWGISLVGGSYTEVVTGLRSVPVTTSGTFILRRVADVPALLGSP